MMTEGRFASLPRTLPRHVTSPHHVTSLALRPPTPPSNRYGDQGVSIHGTLPRRKKVGVAYGASSPPSLPPSSFVHDIREEHRSAYRGPASIDPTMDYVKFSRDKYVMERRGKEVEEELKLGSEELQSHAWYHGAIPRQVAEKHLGRDGDFLVRDSVSSPGCYVLTCQWRNQPQHFKIHKKVTVVNEAYSRVQFLLETDFLFPSVPALICFHVGNRRPISEGGGADGGGAVIFQPINHRLEERYAHERRSQQPPSNKRLSLNILNGHAHDHAHLGRGNLLRNKDQSGSQPTSLNHVQERRHPLQTHQSESFLPLGSRPPPPDPFPTPRSPVYRTGSEPALTPSFLRRTPIDPPSDPPIRGSDLQLFCPPKPPPKPSKVPSVSLPHSPHLTLLVSPSTTPPDTPLKSKKTQTQTHCELKTSSVEWEKLQDPPHHDQTPASNLGHPLTQAPGSGSGLQTPHHGPTPAPNLCRPQSFDCGLQPGYVDRLRPPESVGRKASLHRNSYHHEKEEEERKRGMEEEERSFKRPVFETESMFKPWDFESRLLPRENKPLEMSVLKKVKELLLTHDHRTIAKHILLADCEVARIVGVSEEVKGQMGVASGLELMTLPHGRQLRLDLLERHSTMAMAVAVDILGCTGSLDDRLATLNRLILVAMEMKDHLGDLYAFSFIMKALNLPQITRLEHTWTTLRRKFTQTAVTYEKTLKPFYKGLYQGTVNLSRTSTSIPLLLPLASLMERPFLGSEDRGDPLETSTSTPLLLPLVSHIERPFVGSEGGGEPWETTNDQGCEIIMRHLEDARSMARYANQYTANAERILQGFQPSLPLSEIFRTDFQQRLLWGSRGAAVTHTHTQADRYHKFNLILTALSRRLEPPI